MRFDTVDQSLEVIDPRVVATCSDVQHRFPIVVISIVSPAMHRGMELFYRSNCYILSDNVSTLNHIRRKVALNVELRTRKRDRPYFLK